MSTLILIAETASLAIRRNAYGNNTLDPLERVRGRIAMSAWRGRSRERDLRDGMDRWRRDDRSRDYHDDRRRPDARGRGQGWGGQRDHFDGRRDEGWAYGPRSGTDDCRGRGAPRPSGGHQFETRHDSRGSQHQGFQHQPHYDSQGHQPRFEAMAARNSSARRDEPPRRRDEPSRNRDEPQRRRDEPSRQHNGPASYGRRDEAPHDSGNRAQKRRLPDSTASAAQVRRVGTPSS